MLKILLLRIIIWNENQTLLVTVGWETCRLEPL